MPSFEETLHFVRQVTRASTLPAPGDHIVRTSSRSLPKPQRASSGGFFDAHFPKPSVRHADEGRRDVISKSLSEYNAPNHERHPPLSIQIPPSPPPSPPPPYSPSTIGPTPVHGAVDHALPDRTPPGFPYVDPSMSPSASLSGIYFATSIALVIDPEMQSAELSRRSTPLSCFHVMINALVFLASTGILVTTITLFFFLPLDQLGAPNPAAVLVVLFSAASAASSIVTVYRLEKRVPPQGRATWSTSMAIGVPLLFFTCAILAFTTFLVGINLSSSR